MKKFTLAVAFFATLSLQNGLAQSSQGTPGNYWVILGAYQKMENATRFSQKIKKPKLNPKIELNTGKNLYYVYVMETIDHDAAIAEVLKYRDSTPFKDAWVFTQREPQAPVVEVKPVIEDVIVPVKEEPKVVVKQMSHADSVKMREDNIKKQVESKNTGPVKKGEMEKLDFIFFYKDAAILRPESRFEVDRIARLMKENPKEAIRIHGHTNGNAPGKIIKRKDNNADFFSLDNTVEDYGSAKELSELRATMIRDYLVKNGIDKKRMSIKAWGGKKPIYKVDDDKAEANVRVEIEVVKNTN
jgi:outer membrane protein OmpA-like peptidoglycan-associated protein